MLKDLGGQRKQALINGVSFENCRWYGVFTNALSHCRTMNSVKQTQFNLSQNPDDLGKFGVRR